MTAEEIHAALRGLHAELTVLGPDDLKGRDPGEHPQNLSAGVMALPSSSAAASAAIRWCGENGVAIVPQGGRTGLAGGAVSRAGELILSTSRLTTIEKVDAAERTATVQAGVTLEALQAATASSGLIPGIDLASRSTATIGGMISTNAGGILAFRNGVMRHLVLGLEAVLPDGTIIDDMTRVVKVSAGPDIKQLLIGAEGAYGFITRAVIKLEAIRAFRATALLGVSGAESALAVIARLESEAGISLEGAELMWRRFYERSASVQGLHLGWLEGDADAVLLVEISAASEAEAAASLEGVLAEIWERATIAGGIIAQSHDQRRRFWAVREQSEFIYRDFPDAPSYDVSIPPLAIDSYVATLQRRLSAIDPDYRPFIYGHVADGNLHIAIDRGGIGLEDRKRAIDDAVYEGITSSGGSFSAEHGVGFDKRHGYLAHANPTKVEIARRLKQLFDPGNLFNPGKVPFM